MRDRLRLLRPVPRQEPRQGRGTAALHRLTRERPGALLQPSLPRGAAASSRCEVVSSTAGSFTAPPVHVAVYARTSVRSSTVRDSRDSIPVTPGTLMVGRRPAHRHVHARAPRLRVDSRLAAAAARSRPCSPIPGRRRYPFSASRCSGLELRVTAQLPGHPVAGGELRVLGDLLGHDAGPVFRRGEGHDQRGRQPASSSAVGLGDRGARWASWWRTRRRLRSTSRSSARRARRGPSRSPTRGTPRRPSRAIGATGDFTVEGTCARPWPPGRRAR